MGIEQICVFIVIFSVTVFVSEYLALFCLV